MRRVDAAWPTRLSALTGVHVRAPSAEQSEFAALLRRCALVDLASCAVKDLHRVTDTLQSLVAIPSQESRANHGQAGGYDIGRHPIFGLENPIAPPLHIQLDEARKSVIATASFSRLYEAVPGVVFGGTIAACFDAVLGVAAALRGVPVLASRISVEFERPAPIETPLVLVARLDSIADREIAVSGRLSAVHPENSEHCRYATATATFSPVGHDKIVSPTAFVELERLDD